MPKVAILASALVLGSSLLGHAEIPPALQKINHILVIFEENHSFDNMYGTFPGADGLANEIGRASCRERV